MLKEIPVNHPPATDHPKKTKIGPNLKWSQNPQCYEKVPIFLHILLQWFQSPCLFFSCTTCWRLFPAAVDLLHNSKEISHFPKSFVCYKFKVSKSEKSNTVFTTLQHLIYYTMCMCLYVPCLQGKKFCSQCQCSYTLTSLIDVNRSASSCHPWKKMAQRENKSCSQRWKTHLKKKLPLYSTLNNCIIVNYSRKCAL